MNSKKSCEILIAFARSEKQLEILRQSLCELPDFEPYAAFRHIDQQRKNYLQTQDFLSFFQSNRINIEDSVVDDVLVRHYDYDHDGKLCYGEFLRIILPNDEPGLRTLVTQRPTYAGELPGEVEEALAKLLQTEISAVQDLEPLKQELFNGASSGLVSELFREIDKDGTGFLTFANLFDFFKRNGVYPYEEEIIAIIRKLDKDDDGRLVLEELEEGLGQVGGNGSNKAWSKNSYNQAGNYTPGEYRDQSTSLKKSYKYEGKYAPKYDEQLTEKGPAKFEEAGRSQEKLSRSYNYKETTNNSSYQRGEPIYQAKEPLYQPKEPLYQPKEPLYSFKEPSGNYKETTSYQKTTNSYVKRPVYGDREPEESKDYIGKYPPQKEYKKATSGTTGSGLKSSDYPIDKLTKSPPRTFYYPYEPMRKAFSPMKDKILKSSRFDAPEDPFQRKTKAQLYQSSNTRTRTPNQPRPEAWKIEDQLKKIDDTYAKNSRYHGLNNKGQEDLVRSAPKQMLYRDYTPEPGAKRAIYKTVDLTPDKMFDTGYIQSSQYRKDREIVDKIMGSSEKPQPPSYSYKPTSSSKQQSYKQSKTPSKSSESRDLAVFLVSLMSYEAELERLKQDLALRPDFNLVDLFVFFDREQKGYCGLEEFIETLRTMDLGVGTKESTLFIKRFDRTGSGMLKFADFEQAFKPLLSDYVELLGQRKPINTDLQFSYKELFSQETLRLINNVFRAHFTNEIAIEGLRKALARKEELELRRLFESLDLNMDGFLVEGEFDEFVSSQGVGMNWNRNDLRLLVDRMDNDRDGKVCYEEFCFELGPKLEEME